MPDAVFGTINRSVAIFNTLFFLSIKINLRTELYNVS